MGHFELKVNGQTHPVEADPETPLLWVLREQLNLTGTKFGCGVGACGACTVHLDGQAERSCQVSLGEVGARAVTTIEGLAPPGGLHPVQQAWLEEEVPQCGYCQSGQIMAAAALLSAKPDLDEQTLRESMTNLCRCGTYNRIQRAILRARDGQRGK